MQACCCGHSIAQVCQRICSYVGTNYAGVLPTSIQPVKWPASRQTRFLHLGFRGEAARVTTCKHGEAACYRDRRANAVCRVLPGLNRIEHGSSKGAMEYRLRVPRVALYVPPLLRLGGGDWPVPECMGSP